MGSVVMVVVGCGVVRAPASIGSVVVVVVDCDTGKVPSSMVVVSCGMIMSPANVVGCGVVRAPSNMASVVVVVTGGVEIVVSCGIDAAPLIAVVVCCVVVCAVVVVVPSCGGSTGVTGKFPHPFKSAVAASSIAAFAR